MVALLTSKTLPLSPAMAAGFNRITLLKDDPSDGFQNVVITYKYSEYKFDAAATPIRLAGTRFFHGTGGYDSANIPGQH